MEQHETRVVGLMHLATGTNHEFVLFWERGGQATLHAISIQLKLPRSRLKAFACVWHYAAFEQSNSKRRQTLEQLLTVATALQDSDDHSLAVI
jgi:hypothetical protein